MIVSSDNNGRPAGPVKDFLAGFTLAPEKKEVWNRPACWLPRPGGGLLVSGGGGNILWRIS